MKKFSKKYNFKDDDFLIMGVPEYNNLGDHAIAFAEKCFLEKKYRKKNIHCISENEIRYNLRNLKKSICLDNIIFLQGGGNIGDEYPDQNYLRKKIFKTFKKQKIVVMPSTVFFKNDNLKFVQKKLKMFQKDNLCFFCREKYTFEFLKQYNLKRLYLVPDIVLSLDRVEKNKNNSKKILFCFRSDKEGILGFDFIEKMKKIYLQDNYKISSFDTCLPFNISKEETKNYVLGCIKYFQSFDYVFTDRLHGIIFSYLANCRCYCFNNYNSKIRGIVEWIDCNNIRLIDSTDKNLPNLNNILGCESKYDKIMLGFDALYQALRDFIGG